MEVAVSGLVSLQWLWGKTVARLDHLGTGDTGPAGVLCPPFYKSSISLLISLEHCFSQPCMETLHHWREAATYSTGCREDSHVTPSGLHQA